MIPRISRGSSARAALAYDFGPGRREEHANARTVAGNVPGTWRDQAQMIDETVAQRPRVEKGIWRTSLRAAPEDRVLSDEAWGRIATGYIQAMGLSEHPWTATRHGDDHIHLTVSRVSWEGKVASLSHDFAKAQTACRAIEVEHHLVDASAHFDRDRPQISHGERERSTRLAAGGPGTETVQPGVPGQLVPGREKEQLRELVANATTLAAAGEGGREGFEEWLGRTGVIFRANVASTGRVSGYSYGLPGHVDARGEQVFFKGSQLGKAHSWAATSAKLTVIADHRPGRGAVERAAGATAASAEPTQQPVEKPAGKPAVQVDRERLLADHRAVLVQRQQLTRERVSADSAHRGSLAALAAARRVLEAATRSQRDASSQWEQLARQVARTAVIVAEAIAAGHEVSAARRAREQLAAPFTALSGRPSAAAQRAAGLQAAQRADEVAQARELAGRERLATADRALQVAQQQVAAAQGEVDRTGPVAVEAGVRQRRAVSQLTVWEVEQARHETPSRLVQEALARARGRGPGPGHLDPWRRPPGQDRGPGLSR